MASFEDFAYEKSFRVTHVPVRVVAEKQGHLPRDEVIDAIQGYRHGCDRFCCRRKQWRIGAILGLGEWESEFTLVSRLECLLHDAKEHIEGSLHGNDHKVLQSRLYVCGS